MPAATVQQAFALALQHHQSGRLKEAEALYRQILAVQSDHAGALQYLGIAAYQTGQSDLALDLIGRALFLDPNNAAAHTCLGEAYRLAGRWEDAVTSYRRAIELNPGASEAYNNLGIVLASQGRLDEAIASYRRALELNAHQREVCNNLGLALVAQQKWDEAIAAYRRAIEIDPGYGSSYHNLGHAHSLQGRIDDAIAAYREAIKLTPGFAGTHNNLGTVLVEKGDTDAAITAYRRAIELQPDFADAYSNLAIALRLKDQTDDSISAYRQALHITPDQPDAWNDLATLLLKQGLPDDAVAAYRSALQHREDDPRIHSNLIFALHFHPSLEKSAIAQEQQRWNSRFGKPPKILGSPRLQDRNPARRLRVGYVSPDFRGHVAGMNLLPLFRHHDHRAFEIVCYAEVAWADGVTDQFRECADLWRSTVGLSDDAVAEMVRQDGVDILVDLAQHTAGNRLPVFALRPAPIQVSFAGYPESTGLEAIGFRISDRWLEGATDGEGRMQDAGRRMQDGKLQIGQVDRETERVFLIDSFWCYEPRGIEVAVSELPAKENGVITFGSLSSFAKVNEQVLKLWARVLTQVVDSRLILLAGLGSQRQRTAEFLAHQGVEPRRVEFIAPRPRADYLMLYHRLDVALDPFPYGGHTTSLDALWMGVPVVSLAGERPVSRAGLSILNNLGLPELVASSEDEYAEIAVDLARNFARLEELRQNLRPRMEKSVLMDAPHFARQIEAAYRAMWQHWCMEEQTSSGGL